MRRHDDDPAVQNAEVVRLDERQLLVRHRSGDRDAFAALVAEYRRPVYSYLIRCGVAAEERDDLFQEIFLRVHRSAGRYHADRPLHPWVFTIVANAVRNHHRRRRVRQLVFGRSGDELPEPADPAPDGERSAAARETVAWLSEAVVELPWNQRQVLLLAGVEGLPMNEISAALEMPVNTVKTCLRRARLTLARRLAEQRREGGAES